MSFAVLRIGSSIRKRRVLDVDEQGEPALQSRCHPGVCLDQNRESVKWVLRIKGDKCMELHCYYSY